MDQLLGFDERLYLAILAARSQLIGVIAVIVTFANFQGLVWWILGGALMRNRGSGRRGGISQTCADNSNGPRVCLCAQAC